MPACPAVAREASKGWWGRKDSNLRSHEAADLQSAPFATRDTSPFKLHRKLGRRWGGNQLVDDAENRKPSQRLRSGAFMGEAPCQSQPRRRAHFPKFPNPSRATRFCELRKVNEHCQNHQIPVPLTSPNAPAARKAGTSDRRC